MKYFLLLFAFLASTHAVQAQAGLEEYTKAEHLRSLRKYKEATYMYNKALEKEPDNLQYVERKCQCYNEAQSYYSEKPKLRESLLNEAVDCYKEVIEKDTSGNTNNHRILASLFSEQRKYDEAVEYLDKAYEASEDIGEKFAFKLEIIQLLFSLERVKEAGPHLEVAKGIFGDTPIPDVSFLNGLYNNVMGKYEPALTDLKVVIEANGEQPNYMYQKGYAHFYLGQYEEAKAAFDKIPASETGIRKKLHKFMPENYLKIADAYASIYEYGKANEMLQVVLGMDPGNKDALEKQEGYKVAANNKVQMLKIQKSLKAAREAGSSDTVNLYGRLCALYYKQGDYEEARRAANEFLSVKSSNPNVSIIRGLAHYQLGTHEDIVEAEYTLQSVGDTDRFGAARHKANFALGFVQKATEQYKLAVKSFEKSARGSYEPAAEYEVHEIMLKMRQLGIDE